MISELTVENFKPFGERIDLPLAPITLIYGPNSGGKSSIIQALMLLKQTFANGDTTHKGGLVARGSELDLGSFHSFVHQHDLERKVGLGIALRGVARTSAGCTESTRRSVITYHTAAAEDRLRQLSSVLDSVSYGLDSNSGRSSWDFTALHQLERSDADRVFGHGSSVPVFRFGSKSAKQFEARCPDFTELEWLREHTMLLNYHGLPSGEYINEELRSAGYGLIREGGTNDAGVSSVKRAIEGLTAFAEDFVGTLRTVSYLGPLRSHPARHHSATGEAVQSVGIAGEHAPQLLNLKSGILPRKINSWFKKLEIPYSLAVRELGDEVIGRLISLVLTDTRTGVPSAPSDIGFGVGQILPILVEGVAQTKFCICVEQPEIHLHPRLQAHLADFFIETSSARGKTGRRTQNQWVLETHSESLMLRLQRRVREGVIPPEDVGVLYVEPGTNGSRVHQLRLDGEGEFLDEWPGGFFEDDFHEIFGDEA